MTDEEELQDTFWFKTWKTLTEVQTLLSCIFYNWVTVTITCIWLIIIGQYQYLGIIILVFIIPYILGIILLFFTFIPMIISNYFYSHDNNFLGSMFDSICLAINSLVSLLYFNYVARTIFWTVQNTNISNLIPIFLITYYCIAVPYDLMASRSGDMAGEILSTIYSIAVFVGLLTSLFLPYNSVIIITTCIIVLHIPITLFFKEQGMNY